MAGIGAGVRPPSAPTHVRGDSSVRVPPACTGERGEEGSRTGATQRRGHDGQVKQGEQEGLHARDSVGPTSGATPRGLNPGFSERIGEFETHTLGRRQWKKVSGYHRQGRVENAFFRYKSIIGDSLRARSPAGQGSEAVLGCEILNRMTALGRPVSYRIGR